MPELFQEVHRIILIQDASKKYAAVRTLAEELPAYQLEHNLAVSEIPQPGYPPQLQLAPREN